ncbi:DUF3883 domain-containing protein [uncultured Flavobacterium sp.]|uniref:sacsin N-terminal ATP-binding-like domain-containing protein n=1 Tax=uncultured Flavobacterium sp. TaxID=165435 RepID=UPI0030815536
MCASYRTKSRNTDFEQHANKIFTAIREINPEYAEKRAIWELFQNALDIVVDKGLIRITKTNRGFKFQHNGRPFNDGNLTGLIKQSSNGKKYGSNEDEIGQYGTGFLSTHVYGKKILIDATLTVDEGRIKKLEEFLIDREANSPEELNKKIQIQDDLAEQICDENGNEVNEHLELTSFEYLATEESENYIDNMFHYIPSIIPYVFAFNNKLDKVEINYINDIVIYQRKEIKEQEVNLFINDELFKFSFLSDNEKNIKIVIPQNNLNFENIPKLFLFYPLMETVNLGVNFLIHAQDFKPNKERDYLFLQISNEEIKIDVELNKLLLRRGYELIIEKVKEDISLDFLSVINIRFIESEDSFLRSLKVNFIDCLKDLERIKVNKELVPLISISYLSQNILNCGDKVLQNIYPLLSEFYFIPEYESYIYLSEKINNWGLENFLILDYKDIFDKIVQVSDGIYSEIKNKESYECFIKTISTNVELLNSLEVIPNIHNEFKFIKDLKKWNLVEDSLINVMDAINYDVSKSYLHKDFYFLNNLIEYTRENFKDDLNKFNNEVINLLEKNDVETLSVNSVKFYTLINSLLYFVSLNKTTDTNKKYTEFFRSIFDLPFNEKIIASPTVNLNYDSSFKLLARLLIKFIKLNDEGYSISVEKLREFVCILDGNSELKKNLLDKLECFPNQMLELKSQSNLKLDRINDEDFKTMYLDITTKEIRSDLILQDFDEFVQHENTITGIQIGDEIERTLSPNKVFFPINDSNVNNLPILLDLIQFMSKPNSNWTHWLPNLSKVKEEILMHKFQDENTRLSLFNILSESMDKINLLGELAKIDDLDSLIIAGKEKQKEEARKNNHLIYIKEIGLKIQNIIEHQLDESLAENINISESLSDEKLLSEEQNGQDFIIYKSGIPIYYIEVKSRWDSEGIVALSKRQVECCGKNKDIYAVITVNVADYKSRNKLVDENISFEDLYQDIYVNIDLGKNFEELIKQNQQFEKIAENTKLIEYRGHIPQDRIKNKSIDFNSFINIIKSILIS